MDLAIRQDLILFAGFILLIIQFATIGFVLALFISKTLLETIKEIYNAEAEHSEENRERQEIDV
jgi:hypothetical protein